MNQSPPSDVHGAARRAVARIRAYGIDGPRPIEEIEALLEYGDAIADALARLLKAASGDELVAAIHLVQLVKSAGALDAVAQAAFAEPSPLAANPTTAG